YKPTNSFASTEISQIWNKIVDTSIAEIQLPNPTSTDIFDGILVAGATTKIPVWIRGDKTGKHAFRFLFGYQSEDENDKIGYRKLQYSMSSQVYPSLKINAFTRPSTNKLSEFILGVEIENMQGVEIKLRQFSSLSPVWGISPTIDAESANNMLGYVNGKQTSFAYFKFSHLQNIIRPHPSPESMTMNAIVNFVLNENLPVIHSSMYLGASNVTLHEEQVICNSAPFSLFSRRSRTIWRTQSLANHYPVIPSAKLPDLFTLYFTDDADIVLFWEAPPLHPGGPKRYGHHFIIGINLSLQAPLQLLARIGKNASNLTFATRSMYAATVAERKTLVDSLVKTRQKDVSPVRLIFVRNINDGKGEKSENSNTMTHNFKACGNLVISFFAHLRNTSWENPVAYSLELPPSNDNLLENDFTWIGITSMNGTLKPEQEVFLQLYACFSRKGVFDINRWRLNVTVLPPGVLEIDLTDGKGVASYAQIPNLPFLVTVAQ
ncbi:Trafficking protein particle complex 8, partial [Physocladia obscura]